MPTAKKNSITLGASGAPLDGHDGSALGVPGPEAGGAGVTFRESAGAAVAGSSG